MTFRYATLSDMLQNNVVFRELNPLNSSLPNFEKLKTELFLQSLPRKKDREYARVLYRILKSLKDFANIVYIGDTFLSDLTVIKILKSVLMNQFLVSLQAKVHLYLKMMILL